MNYSIANTFHPWLLLPTSVAFANAVQSAGKPPFIHILHSFIYAAHLLSIYLVQEHLCRSQCTCPPVRLNQSFAHPSPYPVAAQPTLPHMGCEWVAVAPFREEPRLVSSIPSSQPRPQTRRYPQTWSEPKVGAPGNKEQSEVWFLGADVWAPEVHRRESDWPGWPGFISPKRRPEWSGVLSSLKSP